MSALGKLAVGRDDRHRDGQVEARSGLAQRGRCQVHRDALLREVHTGVGKRRAHALAGLTHRAIGQPDDREGRQPAADVYLDRDRYAVDALERECAHLRVHVEG
jgi:hypothetical protein